MIRPLLMALFTPLAMLPALVLAQTPETATPTPDSAIPTAGPNEIVFVGEIPAPPSTSVTAAFYAITTKTVDDIACATASTTAVDDPKLSAFVLRVDVGCAAERALRHFCWGGSSCFVYAADPPVCDAFRCRWSATVHPGAIVDFGVIPAAQAGELVFIGEVPASPGATVTVQFLDPGTLHIATCATSQTTPTDNSAVSAFLLTVTAQCAVIGFPPKFCWGDNLCHLLIEDDPRITDLVSGVTINLGLLAPAPPPTTPLVRPPGDIGPETLLPLTGGGQTLDDGPWYSWLLGAGASLLALGLAIRWLHRGLGRPKG